MKNRKKILFLVTQSEFGGAQRFIYTLISRQFTPRTTPLDAGVKGRCKGVLEVAEIVIAAGPEGDNANGLLFKLEKENFKVFPLKFLKRSINPIIDFLGILEIRKLIKKTNPDILFLCSTKAGFLGSIAASLVPKPYSLAPKIIYRIGGWTFNDPWPKWKKALYLWLEKRTARFKDFIVNNSKIETEQAKKLGIKPKKEVVTIYNGIDASQLEFLSKEEARKNIMQIINNIPIRNSHISKLALDSHIGIIIGTVANFYPPKGLEYLIKAANLIFKSLNPEPRTPNIKFVIIGEGEERSNLEDLIRKNNLNNVFLAGAIPDAWKYLKAFDIFILPSLKEGFPWTLIEAMAAEVPVIATKAGAIPEIIEHKKSGILIEPKNPEAIAGAITELLDDEKLREDLVKEGRKKVCEKFTLDKMVAEYIKLFDA